MAAFLVPLIVAALKAAAVAAAATAASKGVKSLFPGQSGGQFGQVPLLNQGAQGGTGIFQSLAGAGGGGGGGLLEALLSQLTSPPQVQDESQTGAAPQTLGAGPTTSQRFVERQPGSSLPLGIGEQGALVGQGLQTVLSGLLFPSRDGGNIPSVVGAGAQGGDPSQFLIQALLRSLPGVFR